MIGDESQVVRHNAGTDFTVSDISLNHTLSRISSGQRNLFLNRKARETIRIGKAKIWFFDIAPGAGTQPNAEKRRVTKAECKKSLQMPAALRSRRQSFSRFSRCSYSFHRGGYFRRRDLPSIARRKDAGLDSGGRDTKPGTGAPLQEVGRAGGESSRLEKLGSRACFGCILASVFLPIGRPPETAFAGHSIPRQCHHGCFFFGGALCFCSFQTPESTCSLVSSASGFKARGLKFPNCVMAAREGRHVSRRLLERGRSKLRIGGQEEYRCDHE